MSGSRTTNLRTGSPGAARRSSSAKSSPSVRSSRQTCNVGDLLSVAPVSKGKKPSSAGPKVKNQLQDTNPKPKLTQSFNMKKSKSSPEKKSILKPAWAIKPSAYDDKTERSDISGGTFTLGDQDSLTNYNYSEYPEDDQYLSALTNNNINYKSGHIPKKEDTKRKSLFEFLTDTNRTGMTEQTNVDTNRTADPACWNSNLDSKRTEDGDDFNNFSDADSDFEIERDFADYSDSGGNVPRKSKTETHCDALTDSGLSSMMDIGSIKSWSSSTNKLPPKRKSSLNTKKELNNKSNLKPVLKANLSKTSNKMDLKSNLKTTKNTTSKLTKGNVKVTQKTSASPPSYKHEKQISFLERRELAAKAIQVWWRKMNIYLKRKNAGAAAMKRMMENKQKQLETKLNMQRQKEQDKQLEEREHIRRREEKARAARQSVISEMQNKRAAEKGKSNIKTAKKQTKPPSNERPPLLKESLINSLQKNNSLMNENIFNDDEKSSSPRPSTTSSVARKLEEIFDTPTLVESGVGEEEEDVVGGILRASGKSTYDDLLSTIKELENETSSVGTTTQVWGTKKETSFDDDLSLSRDYLLKLQSPNVNVPVATAGSYLTTDKLNSIISFLDEVEKVEEDVRSEVLRQSKEANLAEVESCIDHLSITGGGGGGADSSVMDSASQVASDISNAITAKKQEINEKKKSLEMMKKAMGQQKEFATMQMIEMDKEHKEQLKIQRDEYEGTIKRHLTFIDQLIDDKKVLTERCEALVTKLKDIDHKYSSKIKQLTETHAVELKKQKEISEAAEKLRREKWVKEKTQEIKEITVKGLEPDIQRLIAKHKAEIKKIKAMKQGEVLDADERVGRKYIAQMEDIRAQLQKEKEIAVKKERDSARERFEGQMKEEEKAFQQQRRRLYQEIEEEKERCAEHMHKYKLECDERLGAMEGSFKQTSSFAQGDHEKQMKDLQKTHQSEMESYKEQVDIEKQQWIENYMKKQETHLLSKERELKEGVREARDKEIEMVISRLEEEATASREESEKTAENRIKRIRDKYEKEIKELEESERHLQVKHNGMKEQMANLDEQQIKMKSECKQKEQEITDLKKITDRLQEERGKVSDIIRQEFADRLVILEEESKRLRGELSEEKARHKFDVDKMAATKEEEMDELHKRVKKAVSTKDENAKLLRQQMLASEKRAEHLEHLLAEQRKKILEG